MVAGGGLEPPASGLWARRAANCSTQRRMCGILKIKNKKVKQNIRFLLKNLSFCNKLTIGSFGQSVMSKKNISQEKIIQSFLSSSFNKSAGSTSLADIADDLEIKKASLYNHFSSKEEMYDSTIEYCKKEISSIPFLTEKTISSIISNKITFPTLLKRLISKYFNLFCLSCTSTKTTLSEKIQGFPPMLTTLRNV